MIGDDPDEGLSVADVRRYFYLAALVVLAVLALIATVRFYLSASRLISVWVTEEFRPLFQAAFNLVVLLGAAAGISVLVHRLATINGRTASAGTAPPPDEPSE